MPIDPGDWDALNAMLSKHARVVNNLRRRVEMLEQAIANGASPSTLLEGTDPGDVWTPPATCVMCGGDKGTRTTLTCAECSAKRNAIIKTPGADRSSITRTSCASCGAHFPASTRFLCTTCSAAFKIWKAALS